MMRRPPKRSGKKLGAFHVDCGPGGCNGGALAGPLAEAGGRPPSQMCCHTAHIWRNTFTDNLSSGDVWHWLIRSFHSACHLRGYLGDHYRERGGASARQSWGKMQFIEVRDRFLDAYLAQTGPRSDVWRRDFLSGLAESTGLHVEEIEELVCNWMLQLAMWHRQPGFLWIDPRYEVRSGDEKIEHHYGVLLKFGNSSSKGVSTQRPRFSLQEFAVNRDEREIRLPDSDREVEVSHWASTVSARKILAAECPRLSPELYPRNDHVAIRRGCAPVRLTRGWSVVYPADIELVT